MRGVIVVRVLSFVLAFGVLLAAPRPARAQSTGGASIQMGVASAITRKLYPNKKFRPAAQKPLWVSRSDCLNHDVITFPITMKGYSGFELQVWAGTVDCTPPAQRVGGSGATCWQVFGRSYTQQELAGGGFNIPLYARNLVAVANRPTLGGGQQVGTVEADVDVCNQGQGAAPALALYFMLVDGTGTVANNAVAVWKDTTYDITPPAPPTGIDVGGGEGHVNLTWTRSTDLDITGYNFYCDPPSGLLASSGDGGLQTLGLALEAGPGAGGFTGAGGAVGAGGDLGTGGLGAGGLGAGGFGGGLGAGGLGAGGFGGGLGAGGLGAGGGGAYDGGVIVVRDGGIPVAGVTCGPPSVLAPGTDPSALTDADGNNPYLCGHATGISVTSGKAEGLSNGRDYVVAIGAVDTVGNVGKLSSTVCATPVQVTDFFELYRDLGGQGGCAISYRTRGSGWAITALGAVVFGMMLRRRQRRS